MDLLQNKRKYLSVILLCVSGILIIGLQLKFLGLLVALAGCVVLIRQEKSFARDMLLLYLLVAFLGVVPITTDISYKHILTMGGMLLIAILVPYLVSKFIYKDGLINFKFLNGRRWTTGEILYIPTTLALAYFVLPFYLHSTGAYVNWGVDLNTSSNLRFFVGINILGIWDELFFINTVLAIFRKYFKFWIANIAQATLFASFLYELGFTSWGFVMIFVFALTQGFIYKKTESLLYVITLHLSIDLVLFLSLIHMHYPNLINIFFY